MKADPAVRPDARRAPRTRREWLDYFAYVALRAVALIFNCFPVNANLATARALGSFWYGCPRWVPILGRQFARHRARAEEHLHLSFPDLPQREVSRIARASMQSIAMTAVEVLLTPRLITPWSWSRYLKLKNIEPVLRALLARRGAIMVTAHYGNWEILGYAMAKLGFELVAVMRPLDNDYLNDYLLRQREQSGLRLLYKKGATQSMDDVLAEKGTLCFIGDQHAGSKGLRVDFFGRPASTYKSIAILAIRHRVPIIVGYGRRLGGRYEFELGVQRVIQPEEWEGKPDELRWITEEFTRAMEAFIREAPEQYLWIHRRWKVSGESRQGVLSSATQRDTVAPGGGSE